MSQENVEIVRRWSAGFNEDGLPPFDLCDERIEIGTPRTSPSKTVYRGHDGVRRWRAEVFGEIENVRVEVDDLIEAPDGETVVMALRVLFHLDTVRSGPRDVVGGRLDVRDGKRSCGSRGTCDMADALEAVGLSEQDAHADS